VVIVIPCVWQISNRISHPKFSKVVVPILPNEPPRWPSVCKTVVQIVEAYAKDARKYERLGDDTYRTTTQFKFTEHAWAVSKAAGGI